MTTRQHRVVLFGMLSVAVAMLINVYVHNQTAVKSPPTGHPLQNLLNKRFDAEEIIAEMPNTQPPVTVSACIACHTDGVSMTKHKPRQTIWPIDRPGYFWSTND